MKKIATLFLLLFLVAQAEMSVYDRQGRRIGWVKQDPFNEERLDFYDRGGRRTGWIKRSSFDDSRWDVYDAQGRTTDGVRGERIESVLEK